MDLKIIGIDRVLNKFNKTIMRLEGPLLHFELIKLHYKIQNAIILCRKSMFVDMYPEHAWKLFYPKLRNENIDVKKMLFCQYIFDETVCIYLFKQEENKEDHSFLLTYINILSNVIQSKFQPQNFQLSGVAYLLNYVFLQHQSWTYSNENQKTQITLGCLNIFHQILQKEVQNLDPVGQKMFALCQHAFLNDVYIIESFLRLFVKEKYHLIFLMERESNWFKGPALDRLKCIQMQLALLLLVMKLKKSFKKCSLDDRITNVVKPVASYFTNSYSPVIAELSCRFLEKLAQDPSIPLLALLELDHYQVQSLFLERLRDPLEEEKLKIAIIDLINICVSNQNGMTAAFFNLKCFMYWDGTEHDLYSGDSISDFMVDYLQNIKKSHEYFKHPLQLGILRLLYNLWLTHRENLIDNIANLKDFWPVMADPFFCDYVQEAEIYTIILKILNLEIGKNKEKVDEKLINTIDKFFKDHERLAEWTQFVLESSESSSKDNLDLLDAWIEFLVLTKTVTPSSFDDKTKIILIDSCLNGINVKQGGFNNIEVVYLWTQLFLILSTAWKICEHQQKDVLETLMKFLHSLNAYYKYLSPKIKEVILCVINRTITDFHKMFSSDSRSLVAFLYTLGLLIDMEHEYLMTEVWRNPDHTERIKLLKPWLIIICIGNAIMALDNVHEIGIWFHYRNFLQRVVESVGPMLQQRSTLPFAKLSIDFMISYAESPYAKDYLNVDLFSLFYKIRPPSLSVKIYPGMPAAIPVYLKEWWLIFITLVKLNRILVDTFGIQIFDTCFSFIAEHDKLLRDVISLTRFTVDMTALTLVCETLKFIYIILKFIPQWFVQYPHSYNLITNGIKTSLNACVLSILGYKKINFYKIGEEWLEIVNSPPTDLLVSVLNKLTEVIYWSSVCLRKTKPDAVAPVHPRDIIEQITILIDCDFSVPRFELPITSKLTYGTLLCLADCLCKTLNQLSPETPSAVHPSHQISLTDLDNEVKVKNLGKIFEYCTATYDKYMGVMVYLQKSDDLPNEKLSSFLHFDMSEFSGSNSVISQLDYQMVKNCLESMMCFLAFEVFYSIKNLSGEALFSYKRELSSEIQFFYEFVRKRTSEQYSAIAATPRSSGTPLSQNETDIIKRYVITKVNDGDINSIADNNFVLVISQWLMNFCQLSN